MNRNIPVYLVGVFNYVNCVNSSGVSRAHDRRTLSNGKFRTETENFYFRKKTKKLTAQVRAENRIGSSPSAVVRSPVFNAIKKYCKLFLQKIFGFFRSSTEVIYERRRELLIAFALKSRPARLKVLTHNKYKYDYTCV